MIKPSSCVDCPLYESSCYEPGGISGNCKTVILSSCPPSWGGLFTDKGAQLLRGIIYNLKKEEFGLEIRPVTEMAAKMQYLYTTYCHSESLVKKEIEYCRNTLGMQKLCDLSPDMIICLGTEPAVFFQLPKVKQRELRGRVMQYTLPNGKKVSLVFTLSLHYLMGSPGVYSLIKGDISRAAKVLRGLQVKPVNPETFRETYDIPWTLEEVREACEEYSTYSAGKPIAQTLMSLDTETNTLHAWWHESKIISVSAGFGSGKALSFMVEHKEASYSLADVAPHVFKLTMSDHPKGWWNYKFDLNMFRHSLIRRVQAIMTPGLRSDIERESGRTWERIVESGGVLNTRWDGLLGEHILDEDKQGWYGLKTAVADYKFELYGYEDMLSSEFSKIEDEAKERVQRILGDMSFEELGISSSSYSESTTSLTLKGEYEALKSGLKRKLKRAKARGEELKVLRLQDKISCSQEEYKDVKSKVDKATKKETERFYVKKPKVAGEPTLYTYEDLPATTLLLYGAIDADATAEICLEQRRKVAKEDPKKLAESSGRKRMINLMDRHYLPLTERLAMMQVEGVFTDKEYLGQLRERLLQDISSVDAEIRSKLEEDFPSMDTISSLNLNSTSQLGNIIFGYYGLPVLEETEKGEPSLTDAVLHRYHKEHGNGVVLLVSKYRKLTKALGDFVDKLDYLSGYDSRLHGNIHLNGAKTGRTSSSDPNLQNITERVVIPNPDDTKSEYIIKKIITASPIHEPSHPGWDTGLPRSYYMEKYSWKDGEKLVVVDADLSGAEVKVMTRFAPDPGLIQALTDGFDAHSWITSEIHGIPYEDVQTKRKLDTEEGKRLDNLRGGTKGVVFKILYGGEPEDQALKELIFRRFPGIPKYLEEVRRAVHKEGKVFTPNGRARRFPLVKVDRWVASRNERQAINYNIQSYCSDIVLNMLVNLANNMHEIRGRLLLTVHDSVVFECPESEVSKLPEFLQKHITEHIATEFPDIPVPMTFGYKLGWNYGEMYSIKDWLSMSKE